MEQRIALGWQCPECYGVRIATRPHRPHEPYRFMCDECGAQWSSDPDDRRDMGQRIQAVIGGRLN
jgi:hypothetical protein